MKYISLILRLVFVSIIGVFIILVGTPQELFPLLWRDTIKVWREQRK